MRIPGLKTARQLTRQWRSRLIGGALILGYHRIAETPSDPFALSVSPRNFAAQLHVVRRLATPVPLSQLVHGLPAGALPRPALALTFDDGYADNLHLARPLLEHHHIPATLFAISGYLGQEFWWDELTRLVCHLSDPVSLHVSGREYHWQPQPAGAGRRQLLESLYWTLRPLPQQKRQQALAALRSQTGAIRPTPHEPRALTPAELCTLADSPLIEIGSHTHTHPALTDLDADRQRYELAHSRATLEAITGRTITGLSFPNGSYAPSTLSIAKEVGYTYACNSDPDAARPATSLYRLPRLWVPNLDGPAFARWLRPWLAG